jgi:prepilin-type N-terminal cleavage/methylation domain-containing protein
MHVPPIRFPRSRQNGFTLIELLAVIAIISLLASLLLPAITTVKRLAARTGASNSLRSLGLSVQAYTNDWEGFLPGPLPGGCDIDYLKTGWSMGQYLWPYFNTPTPSSTVTNTLEPLRDRYRESAGFQTFFARNNHYFPLGVASSNAADRFDPCGYPGTSLPHQLSEISRADTTIFFQDASIENYVPYPQLPATAFYGKYLTLYYDNHVEALTLPNNKILY